MNRRLLLLMGAEAATSPAGVPKAVTLAFVTEALPGDRSYFLDYIHVQGLDGQWIPGIIANESFEAQVVGFGNMADMDPAVSLWQKVNEGNAIICHQVGPFYPGDIEGSQVLVLQGGGVGVSQVITLTTGRYYQFNFYARQRFGDSGQHIYVLLDGQMIQAFQVGDWTQCITDPILIS
ncbi:hypothetical protein [Hymenobacter rubidus]|uniref:hypothetical protein n=1 Tax=Hymenobacter rubidus TaxID=1441626 RepID=UPI00191EB912|nr:hypothetical protein [Hymenobacter rubidus]